MPEYVSILLAVLLVALTGVAVKVFLVLGDVQKTLQKVDETRAEVTGVVKQLEEVVTSTNKLLKEELAPTIQVARETLANVEVMTHALADTTTAARRVAQRAESLVSSPQLLALGSTVGQFVVKNAGKAAVSALKGVGNSVMSLFGRRKPATPPVEVIVASAKTSKTPKALSGAEEQVCLPAGTVAVAREIVPVGQKEKVRKGGR
jgi:uncharacterized protein YoxC